MPSGWSVEPSVLTELSSKVLARIVDYRSRGDFGEFRPFQAECLQLLASFDEEWKLRCAPTDAEPTASSVRYALVAFLDETVAHSEWPQRHDWESDSLEIRLFDSDRRGREFYTRLDRLMKSPDAQPAVLLVYYTCLLLGFRGQYLNDEGRRQALMKDVRGRLAVPETVDLGTLSPSLPPREVAVRSRYANLPKTVQGTCLVVVVVLAAVYLWFQLSY
jgi:type IV/VI secretion system ImpK/VasF family protein